MGVTPLDQRVGEVRGQSLMHVWLLRGEGELEEGDDVMNEKMMRVKSIQEG